ncbi:hypothetical protein QYS48_31420 [Marivirga arenosa]|uniref:Uncharacterized protein n=1 Tax=Marivirga arenosa TaxID=3059076 RepID=A0AA51RC66_9BACT|nr:hypothetical protein [Marivirga sp. ABR2-2]WMN06049.1 hypothetical protein QYS48_31420 [Marivirga sp. ABR2-2]
MKAVFIVFSLLVSIKLNGQSDSVYTQSYLDKSTRFAWLTYGGDLNYLSGGTTQQFINGVKQDTDFGSTLMPRLTIGGIHFWGHADFYVTFPLSFLTLQDKPSGINQLDVYQGVETGMRLYPLKLQPQRLSPFLGISFRRFRFSQESEESNSSNGIPSYGRFIHPLQFGLTYTSDKWHISASGYYNYQNEFDYYISPTETADVRLNPVSVNLSLLRYIDTDRHFRTPSAARQLNDYYKKLKSENLLSAWFFGIGPSAALQMNKSTYLKENHPFLYDNYSAAILPDLTFGRYFNNIDANVNLAYRTYGDRFEGFGTEIRTRRHSVGVESVKFLFNYLGFVPFVGPIISYENLNTSVNGVDYTENKLALGVTFGWDIRVTKTGTSLLRTNLRYNPNLHMSVEGEKMMFDHLEFNFIQWVQFIGRKKALRK